jgi:hypothetical protein
MKVPFDLKGKTIEFVFMDSEDGICANHNLESFMNKIVLYFIQNRVDHQCWSCIHFWPLPAGPGGIILGTFFKKLYQPGPGSFFKTFIPARCWSWYGNPRLIFGWYVIKYLTLKLE